MELYHFRHQHPLILHEELKENDDLDIACYGCNKPIVGPNYRCSRECNFFLHNSCAELPREMQHWLHPKHPLTLIEKQVCLCDACGRPVRNLTYNCSLCNFNVDLRCVSLPRTIEHSGHEHPFTLLTKRARFCCDACGKEGEAMSYLCNTCQFWVHLECASLPWNIELSDHSHPLTLTLTYSFQGDGSNDCRICYEEVKTDHWFYHCADCSYLAHVGCATSKGHSTRKLMRETEERDQERENINHSLQKLDIDTSTSLRRTIVHFGHEHPLRLMVNDAEFLCDACGSQGKGSSSYICTTCQFWVHLDCASLPNTISLADLDHRFTLTCSFKPDDSNYCALCAEKVNTEWAYHCADCHYVAHVPCAKRIIRNAGVALLPNKDHREEPDSSLSQVPDKSIDLMTNIGCNLMRKRGGVRDTETETETERTSNKEYFDNFYIDLSDSSQRTIVHWAHRHPLSAKLNRDDSCDACGKKGEHSFYACAKCRFKLHSECALLPKSFKVADKGHLLSLICCLKSDDYDNCAVCHKKVNTDYWVCYCANCHCVFHLRCLKGIIRKARIIRLPDDDHHGEPDSSLMSVRDDSIDLKNGNSIFLLNVDVEKLTSLGEEKVARELEHFSHPHSLSLCEYMENDGKCHGCAEPVSGPAYTCAKCRYLLHKSCAKLPREILKHPLHPQHPLALLVNPPYRDARGLCNACGHSIRHFTYHCSLCKFDLDLLCVSLPCTIQHLGHEHPLTLLRKAAKFVCYACGTGGDGNSYLCTTCLVLFHLECASSPSTIKLNNHNHSLRLSLTLDSNHPKEYFCVVCEDTVKLDHWYYFCEKYFCDCAAHLRCVSSKKRLFRKATDKRIKSNDEDDDDDDNAAAADDDTLDPKPIPDESIFITTNDDKNNCAREETIGKELSHFSHQHCLILRTHELKTGEKCNGCTQPISCPFYSCSECNFYLHKSCTQLRSEVRHPLHLEHRLKLTAKRATREGLPRCKMCWTLYSGFSYFCEYCDFELDIVCSSILGNQLKHEAHEHVLNLSPTQAFLNNTCRACGKGFLCALMKCSFTGFCVHVCCATLPRTVWHKIHRHPFTLCYVPVGEDDSGEYYCDICEKKRSLRNWFYYCAECDYPAHVSCMVGSFKRIKFGEVLNIPDHPHSVTVVKKYWGTPWNACFIDEEIKEISYSSDEHIIVLHCAECNIDVRSFCSPIDRFGEAA